MRISVVIPTLNEESRIGAQLAALARVAGLHEIVVADGGSKDRTREIVRSFAGVRIIDAEKGRARQMNAGAAVAGGDVIVFLHADVMLPDNASTLIADALAQDGAIAGFFKTWTTSQSGSGMRGYLWHLADLRSRYTSLPYGDQALFIKADIFRELGGFADLTMMEDLEFSRRLRRRGRVVRVPASVTVSARRFEKYPIYSALAMNLFPLLYRLGVPTSFLARLYPDAR